MLITYLLRDVPKAEWDAFKRVVGRRGQKARTALLQFIRETAQQEPVVALNPDLYRNADAE